MGFLAYCQWMPFIMAMVSLVVQDISAQCTGELSVSTSNLSPESGDFLIFYCNVSSANFERASWYRGETLLVMGNSKFVEDPRVLLPGEVDVGDGCFNYGMAIFGVSPDDAGEFYTCRINNDTSAPLDIDVIVVPDSIYPMCHADLQVGDSENEDGTITLTCRTQTGNPPWTPVWGSTIQGGVENVSMSGEFTTSLLDLAVTSEVLGSTFTCSAACNMSHDNCVSGSARNCSVGAPFTAYPVSQRIEAGGDANFTCETSIRNHTVGWNIPASIQGTTMSVDCSDDNSTCALILIDIDPASNGTQFQCFLKKIGSSEILTEIVSTLLVVAETTTLNAATTMMTETSISNNTVSSPNSGTEATSMRTTIPSVSTVGQNTSQQHSSTPFITPPPPPPPSPPSTVTMPVTTTPFSSTTASTTMSATTKAATTPTSSVSTTTPITFVPTTTLDTSVSATTATTVITTTTTAIATDPSSVATTRMQTTPVLSQPSTEAPVRTVNASMETPNPDLGENSSAGVSVAEIISIVVTISILLIVLIICFTCLLIRRNASAEKRGRLRRDAAMLDSQAPSPFNAYDMQTVLGGKDAKEMSGPTEEKSDEADEPSGYLLPIPYLDADDDDVDDNSFDNPVFERDPDVYASIPSKSNSAGSFQGTLPRHNGSIDQGYYEHYPDPELGGGTRVVHGIISTVL